MALTLDEANRIVRGAIAKAQELNIRISAAVCFVGLPGMPGSKNQLVREPTIGRKLTIASLW